MADARSDRIRQSGVRLRGRWFGRDGRRALIVSCCLVALLALGTQLGGRFALVRLADPAEPAFQGGDLNTGTLLIVPRFGTECRLLHIDNTSWRISDRGVVDCEAALAESKERAQNWSAARVDSIRDGFRKR